MGDPRPRWAYFVKGKAEGELLFSPPERIRLAWPQVKDDGNQSWMVQRHPTDNGFLIIFPRYEGGSVTLDEFGPPRETHDGMIYYPSKVPADDVWLIRPEAERPPGEWVTTFGRVSIHIAIAFATPRRLIISASGGHRLGKPLGEFGRLGHELYGRFTSPEGIPHHDTELMRFVFLALRESYWVTEEICEDWEILSDRDINPIVMAAMGCSPKPSAAEPAGSPSSAPTTGTSR